ncbi:MAG: hypothetical protein RIC14_17010 [Filomicrobium sp.]
MMNIVDRYRSNLETRDRRPNLPDRFGIDQMALQENQKIRLQLACNFNQPSVGQSFSQRTDTHQAIGSITVRVSVNKVPAPDEAVNHPTVKGIKEATAVFAIVSRADKQDSHKEPERS